MTHIKELEERFGQEGSVSFCNRAPDYPIIEINNTHARASIALHGAHVMHYQPHGQPPLLWMSSDAVFHERKALRGGIPVCWPWFGAHPSDAELPAHGFARNCFWQLSSIGQLENDATNVVLTLSDDAHSRSLWPHAFELSLTVVVGETLQAHLQAKNPEEEPVRVTAALHTYLNIGDISKITLTGLEGVEYIDTLDGDATAVQEGTVCFEGEMDRVYRDSADAVVVCDPVLERNITVKKGGSKSTVVWNPWIDKSSTMADFEADGHKRMLCIEAANAYDDRVEIPAGSTHVLSTEISRERRNGVASGRPPSAD